jgi:polysaccharide chain length determinant protein (PEP-CTERM system associated)
VEELMLPGQTFTPEEIAAIIWRRKWLLVLPTLLLGIGSVLYASRLPDKYRSQTTILVVPQRVPESYVKSTVTTRIEDRLSTIQQQILSRSRLEPIIRDLKLYTEERKKYVMEDVVARMRNDVEVDPSRSGDAFSVSYVNGDPRLAQLVTARLATMFIDENMVERANQAEGTNQFLDSQLEDARRLLLEHEKKLAEYKVAHKGELPTQIEANMAAMQNAQLQLQALAETKSNNMERRLSLERQIEDLEAAREPLVAGGGPAAPSRDPLADELAKATEAFRQAESRYTPEHPAWRDARRAMLDAQARIDRAAAASEGGAGTAATAASGAAQRQRQLTERRTALRQLDAELQANQADEVRLKVLVASYQAKVDAAPTRDLEMVDLMRDYATLQTQYNGLRTKREDAKLAANLEQRQIGEQFKVLDPARVPERPFSPNRPRLIGMGAAGGLMLGFAIAALLEYRRAVFTSADEIARLLQLPVLALVPVMRSEREVRASRWRRYAVLATTVLATAAGAVAAYVIWTRQS